MTRVFQLALPLAISLIGWSGIATADGSGLANFPQLVSGDGSEELCTLGAATRCIGHIWNIVDQDADELLSVDEIDDFAAHVRRWNANTDRELADRTTARIALLTFNIIGARRVVDSYDVDGDGMLSMTEATADLTSLETDTRPIAAVLLDRDSMNHDAIAGRFGIIGSHLVSLAQTVGSSLVGGDVSAVDSIVEAARSGGQVSEVD